MNRAMVLLLLVWLLQPSAPAPPIATWSAPGVLQVQFEAGDCLFYHRPGGLDTFVSCESPVLLGRGGDVALTYVPIEKGLLTTQNAAGLRSEAVVIPPDPFVYRVVLPIAARP